MIDRAAEALEDAVSSRVVVADDILPAGGAADLTSPVEGTKTGDKS